jgi:hypothetical protein
MQYAIVGSVTMQVTEASTMDNGYVGHVTVKVIAQSRMFTNGMIPGTFGGEDWEPW